MVSNFYASLTYLISIGVRITANRMTYMYFKFKTQVLITEVLKASLDIIRVK